MPDEQPQTRQALYDRIRESSKWEVILEEMIRFGFWPAEGTLPDDPADEIRQRGELERELKALRTEQARLKNQAMMLREMRRRRLEASRLKQKENRERRERERQERAAAWQERKSREIGYLGPGVSGGLQAVESDTDRLESFGLPVLHTPAQLAEAMGLRVGALRFLAFSRDVSRTSHYVRFKMPKKTGGERLISALMPRLKQAQRWILDHLLVRLTPHDASHGFRHGRSIVSNARPHTGCAVVVNMDMKDFFPTVDYPRVKGFYRALGYSEAVSTVLALLCTEAETEEVVLDGITWYVTLGERHLPQGAPTSPAISNLICRRLDQRLSGIAGTLGLTYTRYADDLTFSAEAADAPMIGKLLRQTRFVVEAEGFELHPAKTRVMRRHQRQDVTGVVVNQQPAVARKTLKRFRALLHQIETTGPDGKHWGGNPNVLHSIQGFANYVYMVDPDKGAVLKQRVQRILASQR
ncbi:MAG: RNA-directed DNA polymerase [Candidatus Entotheonella factor]|uniref:RNA-directed DNA polymerase n=1 Tax=Entotheonella factor TaxID=1429438 RepID=W4L7B2_ENTF1|nr:MAG: RNA-directed DNA polymerase [Candidatus Entotheonella factor]